MAGQMKKMNTLKAPCSSCLRETFHKVLHQKGGRYDEEDGYEELFRLIECAGCQQISFAYSYAVWWSELAEGPEDNYRETEYETEFYPSPTSRQWPWWLGEASGRLKPRNVMTSSSFEARRYVDPDLQALFIEIYQALAGGQHRLAAMGIRALLELVMIF